MNSLVLQCFASFRMSSVMKPILFRLNRGLKFRNLLSPRLEGFKSSSVILKKKSNNKKSQGSQKGNQGLATETKTMNQSDEDGDIDDLEGSDEPTLPDVAAYGEKMNKSIDKLGYDLSKLRGGKASPDMFNHLDIEAYGKKTDIFCSYLEVTAQ